MGLLSRRTDVAHRKYRTCVTQCAQRSHLPDSATARLECTSEKFPAQERSIYYEIWFNFCSPNLFGGLCLGFRESSEIGKGAVVCSQSVLQRKHPALPRAAVRQDPGK